MESLEPNPILTQNFLSPNNSLIKNLGRQKSDAQLLPSIKKVFKMNSTLSVIKNQSSSLIKAQNRVKDNFSNTRFHDLSKMLKLPSKSEKNLKLKIAENLRKVLDRNLKKQTQNSLIELFETKVKERINASSKILVKLRNENNVSSLSIFHAVLEMNLRAVEAHIDECVNDSARINLVNVCDQFNRNALHYACCLGELGCIEMLMAVGVDPRVKDVFGRTVLHYAAFQNRKEVVELVKNLYEKACKLNSGQSDCTNYRTIARLLKYKKLKKMSQIKKIRHHQIQLAIKSTETFNYNSINKESSKLLERMNISDTKQKISKISPMAFESLLDIQDSIGRTALHMAALFDKISVIRILLDYGANPEIMDYNNTWPYELSSSKLASSILISRMKHKKKPNLEKSIVIAEDDDSGLLSKDLLLLDDYTLNSFLTENQENYLHIAIKSKNFEAVLMLLEKNLNPLNVNKNNWNAVHYAVKSNSLKILCVLLKGHDDLDKEKNFKTQKKWVMKAWSALDQMTSERYSVFHLAVLNGDCDLLQWLIDTCKKRDIFLLKNPGLKHMNYLKLSELFELSGKKNHTCFLEAIKRGNQEIANILITHGCFLYSKNEKLQNALHISTIQANKSLIEYLIRSDADYNRLRGEKDIKERKAKDFDSNGRLINSFYHIWDHSKAGNIERLAQVINNKEFDVNEQTPKRKQTALHVAVEYKQSEVIQTLFMLGADFSIKNSAGQTAFDIALTLENFHFDSKVVRLLKGESVNAVKVGAQSLPAIKHLAVKIRCRDLSESFTIPKFSSKRSKKALEQETEVYWRLISQKISENNLNFLELFKMLDKDKDDALSFLEFQGLLIFLNVSLKLEQIQRLAMTADTNENGLIEYSELTKHLRLGAYKKHQLSHSLIISNKNFKF